MAEDGPGRSGLALGLGMLARSTAALFAMPLGLAALRSPGSAAGGAAGRGARLGVAAAATAAAGFPSPSSPTGRT